MFPKVIAPPLAVNPRLAVNNPDAVIVVAVKLPVSVSPVQDMALNVLVVPVKALDADRVGIFAGTNAVVCWVASPKVISLVEARVNPPFAVSNPFVVTLLVNVFEVLPKVCDVPLVIAIFVLAVVIAFVTNAVVAPFVELSDDATVWNVIFCVIGTVKPE